MPATPINLEPWLILWAIVTTVVLILAIWRVVVAKHDEEVAGIHIVEGEEKVPELQTQMARKLARIDLWGKALTVISAILIAGIGAAWLYNGWISTSQPIR